MSYPDGHIERFATARKIINEASGNGVTDQVSLQLEGKVRMTLEAYEAMAEAYNKLLNSNDRLARHITGFSSLFEQNKRDLMAHGWDQCAEHAVKVLDGDAGYLDENWLKPENPFRKPIDTGVTE